jgi:hypothetical protein
MEVHHHKHAPGHSKRNWKSGFAEFFMLFVAVFFAFIAENLREHYVEKSREKQYIRSMIVDLKRDTLQLGLVSKATKKVMTGIDTLLHYLKSDINDSVAAKLYRYAAYSTTSMLYQHSTGTLSQLKNAGGFRLLHDTASVNRIAFYDQGNEIISKQGDVYFKETLDIIDMLGEIMDFSIAKPPLMGPAPKTKPVFFIRKDPDKLRTIYNKCFMQQRIIYGYTRLLEGQKKQADSLIQLLNKNYHFTMTGDNDTSHATKKS